MNEAGEFRVVGCGDSGSFCEENSDGSLEMGVLGAYT